MDPGAATTTAPTHPPPVAPNTNVVGAGGFGAILKPALSNRRNGVVHEYPENVTKIFFSKNAYNKIVADRPTIEWLFEGNAGHAMHTYKVQRTFRNLPNSIRNNIATRTKKTFRNKDPVYPLRMPDLGKDFDHIDGVRKEVRTRPVLFILDQILKLLRQVNNLVEEGYIHGDIRDTNVMIQPSTGVMTLIDFDKLLPTDAFCEEYPFGFYNNPPECLWVDEYGYFERSGSFPTEERSKLYVTSLNSYVDHFHKHFDFISQLEEKKDIKKAVVEANRENMEYFMRNRIVSVQSGRTWKMMDAFGLACTLLTFFHHVYLPSSFVTTYTLATFRMDLSTRINNNGIPYTAPQLDACARALRRMAVEVLLPMAEFEYKKRILIDTGLSRAQAIRDELDRVMNPDLLSAPLAAAAATTATNHPLTAEEAVPAPLVENDDTKARKKAIANNLAGLFGGTRRRRSKRKTFRARRIRSLGKN